VPPLGAGVVADVVPGPGTATSYDSDGGGNCSFPPSGTHGLDVALSEVEYGTADARLYGAATPEAPPPPSPPPPPAPAAPAPAPASTAAATTVPPTMPPSAAARSGQVVQGSFSAADVRDGHGNSGRLLPVALGANGVAAGAAAVLVHRRRQGGPPTPT